MGTTHILEEQVLFHQGWKTGTIQLSKYKMCLKSAQTIPKCWDDKGQMAKISNQIA